MRLDGFFGTSDDDFAWAMQMNFFIALRASRAALTVMADRGTGAIVNVASVTPSSSLTPRRSTMARPRRRW